MKVARIFQEPTGKYHVCNDSLAHLDACGPGYITKADAMRAAARNGYTHVIGAVTPVNGIKRIPRRYRAPEWSQ